MCCALIFFVLLAACGQSAEPEKTIPSELAVFSSAPTGGWVFRDATLGEDLFTVHQREKEHVTDSSANHIQMQVELEAPHSGEIQAKYLFTQGRLTGIRAEFTLNTDEGCAILFDSLVVHFNRHCGIGSVDDGFAMWSSHDSSNVNMEILLFDEHKEVGFPYLSLNIRKHGN
jgi:hypothetical protein